MISIIIPAHNEKQNLISLLDHLGQLPDDTTELIIALSSKNNDHSENLKGNGSVQFLKCQGTGRASQMNEAASVAKGAILVFLHADVIPPNSFISDISKTIEEGYEAGFFSYKFDRDNFFLRINACFTNKDGIFTGGGDQCLFIKKNVFDKLNGYKIEQVVMEDFEFFKRMKRNGIRYRIVNNDLIVSARKYENNSYVRVNLSNLLLVILFKLGYPANKLKSLHERLIHSPNQNPS